MQPSSIPLSFLYISLGCAQLFIGPASSSLSVQMNVHCSTRATSFGLDRCR